MVLESDGRYLYVAWQLGSVVAQVGTGLLLAVSILCHIVYQPAVQRVGQGDKGTVRTFAHQLGPGRYVDGVSDDVGSCRKVQATPCLAVVGFSAEQLIQRPIDGRCVVGGTIAQGAKISNRSEVVQLGLYGAYHWRTGCGTGLCGIAHHGVAVGVFGQGRDVGKFSDYFSVADDRSTFFQGAIANEQSTAIDAPTQFRTSQLR